MDYKELETKAKEYLKERGMQGGIGGVLIPDLLASFALREIKKLNTPTIIVTKDEIFKEAVAKAEKGGYTWNFDYGVDMANWMRDKLIKS